MITTMRNGEQEGEDLPSGREASALSGAGASHCATRSAPTRPTTARRSIADEPAARLTTAVGRRRSRICSVRLVDRRPELFLELKALQQRRLIRRHGHWPHRTSRVRRSSGLTLPMASPRRTPASGSRQSKLRRRISHPHPHRWLKLSAGARTTVRSRSSSAAARRRNTFERATTTIPSTRDARAHHVADIQRPGASTRRTRRVRGARQDLPERRRGDELARVGRDRARRAALRVPREPARRVRCLDRRLDGSGRAWARGECAWDHDPRLRLLERRTWPSPTCSPGPSLEDRRSVRVPAGAGRGRRGHRLPARAKGESQRLATVVSSSTNALCDHDRAASADQSVMRLRVRAKLSGMSPAGDSPGTRASPRIL